MKNFRPLTGYKEIRRTMVMANVHIRLELGFSQRQLGHRLVTKGTPLV